METRVKPPQSGQQWIKITLLILLIIAVIVTLLYLSNNFLGFIKNLEDTSPITSTEDGSGSLSTEAAQSAELSLSTLPPPLRGVVFPEVAASYPQTWLEEFILPAEFVLVETSSGNISSDNPQVWSAKLRFEGRPAQAAEQLSTHLTGHGWSVVSSEKPSGGILLLLEKNDVASQGILVIAPADQNPGYTHILATFFP